MCGVYWPSLSAKSVLVVRNAWLPLLVLTAALVVGLFAPVLSGGSGFAFRDAAHFYHPLFQYIRSEWGAGRLPLWNPYENLGGPLVAENTSSVFYPGKLLFALPFDFTWLYSLYIVAHVVLAVATSYRLARHLRASVLGASMGALSYAFAGQVLFQYCNVIFLVGSAWLPLALLYADQMLRGLEPWAWVGFGAVVSLIVLGGDPHLAYNIGLAAAGYAGLLWWNERRTRTFTAQGRKRLPWRPIYLGAGSLLAALLAAVQVLPSLEASPHGGRSHYDEPRNVIEYAQECLKRGTDSTTLEGLWNGSPDGHRSHIYAFSLSPWRVAELVWPNAMGRPFPNHRRWLSLVNAESNVWTPSLYFGLLPLVLALRTFSLRRRAAIEIRWLSWIAVIATAGSLGTYGIGYALKLFTGDELNVGNEVGGVYWLFVTLLPGYVQFRYPQKLLVLTAIALSMLAARGWRTAWARHNTLPAWFAVLCGGSLLMLGLAAYGWNNLYALQKPSPGSNFQGPLDWSGAWNDLFDGVFHTAILSLTLALLFWFARSETRWRRTLQLIALAVVAVDLGMAQKCLIEVAPAELWRFTTKFQSWYPHFQGRVYQQPGLLPPSFATSLTADRYAAAVAFNREALMPKYPLPDRIRVMEVAHSVANNDFAELIVAATQYNNRHATRSGIPEDNTLNLLGAQLAIVGDPQAVGLAEARPIADGATLGVRPNALPRAWIVHRIDVHEELHSRSPREIRRYTYELLYPDDEPRDWRQEAVVETSGVIQVPQLAPADIPAGESCAIEREDPLCIEVRVKLTAPGLVVLAEQFFPGWELTVETAGQSRRQEILRTNRVMRGAVLPAGEHRLIYRYRPKSFYAGAAISSLAVASVAIGILIRRSWSTTIPNRQI